MSALKTLYRSDFALWSTEQAAALRAAARDGANHQLDWENLAEEIESLGISQRSALKSQIGRIIEHLLKLENSPAANPRRGWIGSVLDARSEIERVLEDSPSLKNEVSAAIGAETRRVFRKVIADRRDYGELDPNALARIGSTSYTEDQILGDWLPAECEPQR
ncbi:MAG TPA: DUF29 domain-containing protein [Stellaceae bacterium]|nr:DUF29 domain-containing protein [Stellaceae bacterium]